MPRPVDLGDNDEHEDKETDIPFREMKIELSITTKTKKLTTQKLCETIR
jgi:hypothetical protein